MSTVYYTATTLDGFLAGPGDDLEWLMAMPHPEPDTYSPFIANVGALAMGSATYEWVLRHLEKTGKAWPYTQPSWVFTSRDLPVPQGADVRFVRGAVAPVHQTMSAVAKGKDLWIVGGGDLAGQVLDAGLLDELVITVASYTLGEGKPLLPRVARLLLISARPLGGGFAELRYAPAGRSGTGR